MGAEQMDISVDVVANGLAGLWQDFLNLENPVWFTVAAVAAAWVASGYISSRKGFGQGVDAATGRS